MEEQINSIEQLREYYPDGKIDWPEIIQNFKLTKKFMNDNIANLDTILLFENQELDLEFVVQNIIYFNINDIEKYLNIKDPSMIVSLQAKKDEAIKKSKQIEEKVEAIEEKETEEILDVISEIESITTQSEQAKKDEAINKSKQIEEKVEVVEEVKVEKKETEEVLDVISEIESITTQSEQAKLVRKEEQIVIEEPKIVEVAKVVETPKVVEKPKEEVSTTNSLTKKEEIKTKRPQTLAIIEQLALTRLKELNVDHTTIVGDYLLNSYIDKYNDLKMKYEFSISKFDYLILDSLEAKAH